MSLVTLEILRPSGARVGEILQLQLQLHQLTGDLVVGAGGEEVPASLGNSRLSDTSEEIRRIGDQMVVTESYDSSDNSILAVELQVLSSGSSFSESSEGGYESGNRSCMISGLERLTQEELNLRSRYADDQALIGHDNS